MPNLPEPYTMRDWQAVARQFDALAFDFERRGEFLPLIWWDRSHTNLERDTFGLYSYVGDARQGSGSSHEVITCIGAVLGATLSGIDKSAQNGYNWVEMLEAYFNTANGQNLVLNGTSAKTGGSFWYELYPQILYDQLAFAYPHMERLTEIVLVTADRWREAVELMKDGTGIPDFDYTAFNFAKMRPVRNGSWREPDAAAAVAWIQYMAWTKSGNTAYLDTADDCMAFLEAFPRNPLYEVLLPYGAYLAARMSAELGRSYDLSRLLNACFDGSDVRREWGVIVGRWGDLDAHGLVGLRSTWDAYAFAMNTFAFAGALAPIPRYAAQYARAIGKWLLNLSNAARLFYSDALPPEQQTCAFWQDDPHHVIAYEALRQRQGDYSPYAMGDPLIHGWAQTDFGLYGSCQVGVLGGLLASTSIESILRINLLATDTFHDRAYPTYLYYNPHTSPKPIELSLGPEPIDLYDAVSHSWLVHRAVDTARITIPPDQAVILVLVPSGARLRRQDTRLLADTVIIDYWSAER